MYPYRLISGIFLIATIGLSFQACNSENNSTNLELRRLSTRIGELEQEVLALQKEQKNAQDKLSQRASLRPAESNGAIREVEVTLDDSELDDPYLGKAEAPLSLVMFANYQCQTCKKFVEQSLPQLKKQFVEKDLLKFVYRDFPLKTHPLAIELASLANCAGEQGKYWEAFELLSKETEISLIDPLRNKLSKLLAKPKSFLRCSKSSRYQKEVALDAENAKALGVSGAPSFLLIKNKEKFEGKGILVRGAQPTAVFQREITALLKEVS